MARISRFGRAGVTTGRARRAGGRFRLFDVLAAMIAVGSIATIGAHFLASGELGRLSDVLAEAEPAGTAVSTRFDLCAGPVRVTCVVDGDTIWLEGTRIRIADINTPEISSPGCRSELALGRKATARLQQILNAGPFEVAMYDNRDEDKYGRKLRVLKRDGRSLGEMLVAEGLAHWWDGARHSWCG